MSFAALDPAFEARTRESFARQGIMGHLGAVLESVAPGKVEIALPYRAELSQQHGRSPTVHELAEKLAISEEEVLEGLESANAYSTLSLDVPDTDDESPAVADTLGAEDEALEGVEYRESLKPLLEDLPPREKRILLLRFFANMTQSQIAQEVGISQMHVSRLLARTLAQLREKLLVEE